MRTVLIRFRHLGGVRHVLRQLRPQRRLQLLQLRVHHPKLSKHAIKAQPARVCLHLRLQLCEALAELERALAYLRRKPCE